MSQVQTILKYIIIANMLILVIYLWYFIPAESCLLL